MGHLAETPVQAHRPLPNIRPYFDCDSDLGERIQRILISGQVTNSGPRQQALERRLADWLGVADSVVVSNGADALSLALAAFPAAPGAKAILPSYTFIATLNAVLAAGLTPIFCDIDPETFTLCPHALERLLAKTPDVAWVIPVAVFGIPAELAKLCPLAEKFGARILYDNCHGFGTEVEGARVLSGPLVQTISMHATKVLPGVEGGILLSDDSELLARFRQLRNHGIAADPLQSTAGMNTKLDEVRAEITLAQLAGIDGALTRRRSYGKRLRGFIDRAGLDDVFRLQRIPDGVQSNFQNHGVLCPLPDQQARDVVVDAFQARGIGARPYFHPALHRLPAFSDHRFDLPNTENVWTRWVCLPLHARMAAPDLDRLEQALLEIGQKLRADNLTFNQTTAAGRGQDL
jgi:dTDP-4-amino-4,6-dideoxygalactose transaminase